MRSNGYMANVALGVATFGFIISYPFSYSMYGGMINSGFWAAMIGGLADWFTVTALFRKPLGFSYRTAVIPKNREKIFNDLINFVEKDLLNKSNILNTLSRYDMAELLIRYMEEQDGKESSKKITQQIIQDILKQIDANDIGQLFENLIKDNVNQVKISPIVAQTLDWTVKNGFDEKIINFLLDELIKAVGHGEARLLLSKQFAAVIKVYQQDMERRKFLSFLLDISPDKLADMAQSELIKYLDALKNPSHPLRNRLKVWIADIVVQLNTNGDFQNKVENWKNEIITTKFDIAGWLTRYIKFLREEALTTYTGEQEHWMYETDKVIDKLVDSFKENPDQKKSFDLWVKNKIEVAIDEYHKHLSIMVRERLEEFTEAHLVEFIETKVGDSLQMIRINGSVVGGVAGIALYFLTYWLERLW